jgi:hypothetical protein
MRDAEEAKRLAARWCYETIQQVATHDMLDALRKRGSGSSYIVVPFHEAVGLIPIENEELIQLVERALAAVKNRFKQAPPTPQKKKLLLKLRK